MVRPSLVWERVDTKGGVATPEVLSPGQAVPPPVSVSAAPPASPAAAEPSPVPAAPIAPSPAPAAPSAAPAAAPPTTAAPPVAAPAPAAPAAAPKGPPTSSPAPGQPVPAPRADYWAEVGRFVEQRRPDLAAALHKLHAETLRECPADDPALQHLHLFGLVLSAAVSEKPKPESAAKPAAPYADVVAQIENLRRFASANLIGGFFAGLGVGSLAVILGVPWIYRTVMALIGK